MMIGTPAKKRKLYVFSVQMEIKAFNQDEAYEMLMENILTSGDIELFGSELVEEREL